MKKKKKKKSRKKNEWTLNDFVGSVWKTMEQQAEKNPAIKNIHAKLSPEWNKVIQKVAQLLDASAADKERYIEEICAYGEKAVRPLIDALLRLRSAVLMKK